jgi:hypothetical protein
MKMIYVIGLIIFISLIYEIFLKEVKTFNRSVFALIGLETKRNQIVP